MGTVIKNTRREGDLSKRPLNQDLKGIPGQETEYAKTQKQEESCHQAEIPTNVGSVVCLESFAAAVTDI